MTKANISVSSIPSRPKKLSSRAISFFYGSMLSAGWAGGARLRSCWKANISRSIRWRSVCTSRDATRSLVERNPRSLPHRSLLALTRLLRGRVAEALDVYANIQVAPRAHTSSALAVHAAVLAANGNANDAKIEAAQIKMDSLLPEEKELI